MTRRFRALLAIYSIGVELIVWLLLAPIALLRRAVGRARSGELRERLAGAPPGPGVRVLVHAVSAGEMVAAEPLVRRFAPRTVLLSTQTRAGMDAAERIRATHPHVDGCVWLPWDRYKIRRWLEASGVTAVVVLETEIWPNLFAACRTLDIPLFVANGRMSARDAGRYRFARWFFADVLDCATSIGAQDNRARDRFVAAGAPPAIVHIGGNLKLDAGVVPRSLSQPVAAMLRHTPLVVAGSTHDPEERVLLECLRSLRHNRDARMVLAPRDTGRAADVCALAERAGLRPLRSSQMTAEAGAMTWNVLVLDEYGSLTACYERADVVFIGGTIAPIGGHNVVEAASLGRPVIVGPHVREIDAIVDALADEDAIVTLAHGDAHSLSTAIESLLADPERSTRIGAAARDVCRRSAGAVNRYWAKMAHA